MCGHLKLYLAEFSSTAPMLYKEFLTFESANETIFHSIEAMEQYSSFSLVLSSSHYIVYVIYK